MTNITNVTKKAKKGFKTRPVKCVKVFLKKKMKKKHPKTSGLQKQLLFNKLKITAGLLNNDSAFCNPRITEFTYYI